MPYAAEQKATPHLPGIQAAELSSGLLAMGRTICSS